MAANQIVSSSQLGPGIGDARLPKLSHMVAATLRSQITSGKIPPGSRLPPESELLTIFKVSRPTLREALRILEAESLIAMGRGARSGASVLAPNFDKAGEYAAQFLAASGATLMDLHEARMLFEPGILRLLGKDVDVAVIGGLRQCVDEMNESLKGREFVKVLAGTNRFHAELARSCGNQAIILFICMLQAITDETYAEILVNDRSRPGVLLKNMTKSVRGYQTLCDLLERRKSEEAVAFWTLYMERSRAFLQRSGLGKRPIAHGEGRVS